ncbi:MAG TPA: hypothetical protein VFR85_03610 [Anaeromyxobacteraceae bacterium]|nr:hypothetical protein [Anaeromyxobacteraceae bacterium]
MRRILYAAAVLSFCSLATPSALAKGHLQDDSGPVATTSKREVAHTVTWWCVDLNQLWHVNVPVVIGSGAAIPPDPSPIPEPCTSPFPVAVPNGSGFVPAGGLVWYTNKTYPPGIRAALEATGYVFHSQSPAEDFMSKLIEIRVEIRNFADEAVVAVFSFDPRQNFRLVQFQDFNGQLPIDPIVDPALGIDLSPAEIGRLPTIGFPVIAGPVQPGQYRAWVYLVLSDLHNDGLGLDWNAPNFLPAGETLVAFPRFIVLP